MKVTSTHSPKLQVTGQAKDAFAVNLWKRFQQGDNDAFAQLYQTYVQVIYNYGRKYSGDEALLEDCIQGLFLDLWKNRENLAVPASVRFYLYASIKRRIHKELQKRKELTFEDFSEVDKMCSEVNDSFEELLITAQSKAQQKISLKQGLLSLPVNQRKAILLKFYKDLNFQEISAAMDMSIDNVYKLVSRGLLALRKNVKNLQWG
ncbi:RNA polymerase sigma factor [Rufibacter latericius]|uniref:Sigma-70 family RNA polymerase sigma factor n=1 Tax=Rufibacter latericius TaxID=2487040 RepID=A0A3M9N0S9_9BACT|nr:sigma-70 family RNA polymerase sigma factor [Rufibacter latericius]RNI31409.1 sigma-70 family RNA polymerase sigma factor [Rufibacter latericius]